MKNQVTIGTVWQDRTTKATFEITGANRDAGTIQLSSLGNGGEYKIMKETSLRKNYELVALKVDKTPAAPVTAQELTPATETTQLVQAPTQPAETSGNAARAPVGRVQLKDGTVIPGSKFITQICGVTREDSYKVDSPIRWLAKPDGAALLQKHEATIVTGVKITK